MIVFSQLGAVILNGFLAGASVDRALIQLPAFRRVGVRPWADFSRKADLGNRGFLWYPALAIGGTALSIGAAIKARRSAWLYASAILAGSGLLATIGAAPNMLRVRDAGDDEAVLQRSFDGFDHWQTIRGTLQALAFVAGVLSL